MNEKSVIGHGSGSGISPGGDGYDEREVFISDGYMDVGDGSSDAEMTGP